MARISKEEWKTYGNVFDQHAERLLFKLSSQGHFDELESAVSVGKEANIFTALKKDGSRIIVKIYRLENCNFNGMYDYLKQDPLYGSVKRSRRQVVFMWTQREYRNLLKAREVIKVPTPIAWKDNIILMEYIGDEDGVSLQLKDNVGVTVDDAQELYEKCVVNMKKLFKHGIVHGDLSEFNILNYHNKPIFIDFSQSTGTKSPNALELLRRDCKNIVRFFSKYLEDLDEKSLFDQILKHKL